MPVHWHDWQYTCHLNQDAADIRVQQTCTSPDDKERLTHSFTCCFQAARKLGSFLIVGLHTDEDVTARRGPHLPIMDLHERSLSVLACRFANEVIIGALTAFSAKQSLWTFFCLMKVINKRCQPFAGRFHGN